VQILLKGYQCLRCGHQWKPRKKTTPLKWPACDSPNWKQPRREGMPPHLEEVFRLYEVPADQRAEIIRYAAQHPGVAQALWEAAPELKKVFGKARCRLELEVDPESGWEQLLGMVLLKDYPENALDSLSQFDRSWFLNVSSDVRLHLNFIVELEDDYPV
jgi:hypothetical protein